MLFFMAYPQYQWFYILINRRNSRKNEFKIAKFSVNTVDLGNDQTTTITGSGEYL
ncbi:hypothetical protein ABIB62_000462 [Mucilaginibacter sp. UYP25]|uniref:hypothetical protein n=1 Tax=unclassified Mucilaginibacter TaxID=2617802 RepID=UPI0033975DC6